MAERLTEKVFDNNGKQQDIYEWSSASSLECNKKLGMLEDIMEKYDIESVEELDVLLEGMKKIWQDTCDAKNDRDIWKRACELACETLKQVMGKPLWIGGNIPAPEVKDTEYFYQQAKKEGE